MCLISLAWKPDPDHHLVVAANRDELHARPTSPLSRWGDAPAILAGRDLAAMGTWMGVSESGRFAAVTNFRELAAPPPEALSRGFLVTDFLQQPLEAETWLRRLETRASSYAGFNLFVTDGRSLAIASNRPWSTRVLEPGIHALSNGPWESRWPKVRRARAAMSEALGQPDALDEILFRMLSDAGRADDSELPDTGVGLERERRLSPIFIRDAHYGTRSSSVLVITSAGEGRFTERSWSPSGDLSGEVTEHFRCS